MNNPFETIDARLRNIEHLLLGLKHEKDEPEKDKIFTVNEAASYIDLSPQTIYRLVSERSIPHSKRGKRLYFSKSELSDWIKKGKRKTLAELK